MSNLKKRKIYRIEGLDIDKLVERHIGRIKEPKIIQMGEINMFTGKITGQVEAPSKYADTKINSQILHDKFTFLIDMLIRRSFNNEQGWAFIHSKILESVVGKNYNQLLYTLCSVYSENLFDCSQFYEVGEYPYAYQLNKSYKYCCSYEYNNYLSKYFTKHKKIIKKIVEDNREAAKKIINDDKFFNKYEVSLRRLKIKYSEELNTFIKIHPFISSYSYNYHTHIIERYKEKERVITSVDGNNRIYSILTSTPRIIKPFLNISYTADIHNSHPLLFNSLLREYYNIPLSLLDTLYSAIGEIDISTPITTHYVRNFLSKRLSLSNIEKQIFANIPTDVLKYIIITSKGVFWDVVIPDGSVPDAAILRSDAKVLLFSEVFYGKSLTTRGKYFAKLFKRQFPKVHTVIQAQKDGLKKKDRTVLSNRLMAMESELFHEVLVRLYCKRFCVVSIHDAIVVLDVSANKNCTPDLVAKIIHDVYREYGLLPNVAIDTYGKSYVDKIIEDERVLAASAEAYKARLKAEADGGNDDAKTILAELEAGRRELCFDNNHNIIPHLTNIQEIRRLAIHSLKP